MKRSVERDVDGRPEGSLDRRTVFGRLHCLSLLDEYIPMSLNKEFFDTHPHVRGLHDYINCSLENFEAVAREQFTLSSSRVSLWPGRGNRWETNLTFIGFSASEVKTIVEDGVDFGKAGGSRVRWFNFLQPERPRERGNGTRRVQQIFEQGIISSHVRAFQLTAGKSNGAQYWQELKFEQVPVTPISDASSDEANLPKKGRPDAKSSTEASDSTESSTRAAMELISQSEWYSRRCIDLDRLQSMSVSNLRVKDPLLDEKLCEFINLQKSIGPGGCHLLKAGEMTYVAFPNFFGESPKTKQRKAQCLSLAIDAVSVDSEVASLVCRREPEVFSEGASRAGLQVGGFFNAEETAQIFGEANLTKSTQKFILAALRSKGSTVFTPLRKLEALRDDHANKCVRTMTGMAETGTKGARKQCKAVYLGQDFCELVARMLRLSCIKDSYDFNFRLGDAAEGRDEIVVVYGQDKGGDSIKGFVHLPAVKDPCSVMNNRATWLIESYMPNQKEKPNDHPNNWEEAIRLCDGFYDWPLMLCLQVKREFLFLPGNSVPASHVLPLVSANADDRKAIDDHRAGLRRGSAAEEQSRRATSIPGSAVLITHEELFLGARVQGSAEGDLLYFSFVQPPPVGPCKVLFNRALACSDLLSACASAGQIDTSNSSCLLCGLSPAQQKVDWRSPDSPLILRTHESQAACLAQYLAQERVNKSAVHGVNGKCLYPNIKIEDQIPPPLHMDLGIGNKLKDNLEGYLEKLDSIDPAASEEIRKQRDEIDAFSVILDDVVSRLEALMNDCPDLLGVEDNQPGSQTCSKLDGAMNDKLIQGDPFDALPWSHLFQDGLSMMEDLQSAAECLRTEGDPRRDRGDARLRTRGRREIQADESKAEKLEDAANQIDEILADLLSALTSLQEAKDELSALDPSGDAGGPLLAKFKSIIAVWKIVEESYWDNCLNGPSVRKFLHGSGGIIAELKVFMAEKGYSASDISVLDLHLAVMTPYSELSKLMRSTEMYSDADVANIRQHARDFGVAFRAAYGIDSMFPKAHMAERHVPEVASRLRTLGRLSEEGGEAYHVGYKRAAAQCRSIKNQEGRVRASLRHMQNKQNAGFFSRTIRRRISAKSRAAAAPVVAPEVPEAAEAPAAPAAAAPVAPQADAEA